MNMRFAPTPCGDANPNGNVSFQFKGGCMKKIKLEEAYRCTGCGGWFHRDCIFEHFEKEQGCSKSHLALRAIKELVFRDGRMPAELEMKINELIGKGLDRTPERKSFIP